MRDGRRAFFILALVLAGSAVACGGVSSHDPATGISEHRAIQLATQQIRGIAGPHVTLIEARRGPLRGLLLPGTGMPDEKEIVWAVSFHGVFPPASCGPAPLPGSTPHPCPRPHTSGYVVLDAVSGRLRFIGDPAPAQLDGGAGRS